MPAVALSRVGARVVESGPGGQELATGTWQRLEALPDRARRRGGSIRWPAWSRSRVCAFTAAGNDRFTAVGQWIRRARQTWPACGLRGIRWPAGTGYRIEADPGGRWTVWTRGP